MKEKKLIEMLNRVDKIEKTIELIIKEVNNLRNFSVSVLEVSKRMPSYEKAVKRERVLFLILQTKCWRTRSGWL